MIVNREGLNIVTFTPEGDYEYEWLTLNVESEPYQWMGRTLCVDTRMAGDLLEGVSAEFEVTDGAA